MNPILSLWPRTVIGSRFRSVFFSSMVSMTVSYIVMLTDNVVAGQLLGDDAAAAMTLVFPLLTMLFFLSYLISDGLAMLAAYAQGQGNREEVERLFSLGTLISLALGIALILLLLAAEDFLLSFWRISPELMNHARGYYHGLMWAPPIVFLNICFYTFLVQEGEEQICAKSALISFVVNVALDILLCYHLGTLGIGLATVTGTLVSCLAQLAFLLSDKSRLHFRAVKGFHQMGRGLFYSLYHSMDTLLLSLLPPVLSAYVISHFGEAHLIVVTLITNVLVLIIALYTGLVDCMQPMVCQYHAEGNLPSVKKTMDLGMKATMAISIGVSLLVMVIAPLLPNVFGIDELEIAAEAVLSLRIFLLFTVFLGTTLMYSNYYIYIEKRNYGAFVKTILLFLMPMTGMHLGGEFGSGGLWLGVGGGFAAGFLINLACTFGKQGNLLLMDDQRLAGQPSYDIDGTEEGVKVLCSQAAEDLRRLKIPGGKIELLMALTQKIGFHAVNHSAGKPFQMEFTFDVGERPMKLTARDNGAERDILSLIGDEAADKSYLTTGDENRLLLML